MIDSEKSTEPGKFTEWLINSVPYTESELWLLAQSHQQGESCMDVGLVLVLDLLQNKAEMIGQSGQKKKIAKPVSIHFSYISVKLDSTFSTSFILGGMMAKLLRWP